MSYVHTQKSPLVWILSAVGGLTVIVVSVVTHNTPAILISVGAAATLVIAGLCFGRLTVRDEGPALAIRFGPLPVFRTTLRYSAITEVQPARSDLLDGWGIHWVPGRGFIYNVWGFDCVRVRMGKKTVRIGTDDPAGLTDFLTAKLQSPVGSQDQDQDDRNVARAASKCRAVL